MEWLGVHFFLSEVLSYFLGSIEWSTRAPNLLFAKVLVKKKKQRTVFLEWLNGPKLFPLLSTNLDHISIQIQNYEFDKK